jgi:hypothetical protein
MIADVFVETNVCPYTIDEDPASSQKRERARQLLLAERWGWSVRMALSLCECDFAAGVARQCNI